MPRRDADRRSGCGVLGDLVERWVAIWRRVEGDRSALSSTVILNTWLAALPSDEVAVTVSAIEELVSKSRVPVERMMNPVPGSIAKRASPML